MHEQNNGEMATYMAEQYNKIAGWNWFSKLTVTRKYILSKWVNFLTNNENVYIPISLA